MDFNSLSPEIISLDRGAIIEIAIIVAGAVLVAVVTQRLLPWLADRTPGTYRPYVLASVPVLRLIVIAVAVLLIIPRVVEPTFENVLALVGALGIVLGFALKDYVSSLVAGVVALYEMPYRPGDWIAVEGAYGEVKRIGMRAVEIVTPDDTVVSIPHQKLWDTLIYNSNNGTQYLMCVVDFYLHPSHDGSLVSRTLHDVALTSAFLQLQRPIKIIATEKPWGTHYRLKAYPIDPRDQFDFITDLTLRGKAALRALGMEFVALPALDVGPT
ncbi:MAG: mechanosensitive ion channel [Caldilineaceae bacterium]|nr:mechanosensitive ion channel [Caldilineaceae bacterium]